MILKQQEILKSHKEVITKEATETVKQDSIGRLQVNKAVNEELMQATFIAMVPNEIDAHGDITSEDEVRKACHGFNKHCMQANLFHLAKTDTFEFAESYVCPTDFILGDKLVVKGTWLCTIQCLDTNLWELIKSGEVNGLSIGAMAAVETLK